MGVSLNTRPSARLSTASTKKKKGLVMSQLRCAYMIHRRNEAASLEDGFRVKKRRWSCVVMRYRRDTVRWVVGASTGC